MFSISSRSNSACIWKRSFRYIFSSSRGIKYSYKWCDWFLDCITCGYIPIFYIDWHGNYNRGIQREENISYTQLFLEGHYIFGCYMHIFIGNSFFYQGNQPNCGLRASCFIFCLCSIGIGLRQIFYWIK